MRLDGELTEWNDARGFGFIRPASGGAPLFVHISGFKTGGQRPEVGWRLSFETRRMPDGRWRAVQVARAQADAPSRSAPAWLDRADHSDQRPSHRRSQGRGGRGGAQWSLARRLALPVGLAVYAACVWRWGFDPRVPMLYGAASVLAFLMVGWDKHSARRGAWRVSEARLHAVDLLGGWPGALLAQQSMRHKTRKASYIGVFWLTVGLNLAGLVAWHAGWLQGLRGLAALGGLWP